MERVRIADAFFGPDAESIDGERTLTRRIQVVGDLAALCKLSQPSRRGKPFNWNKEEKTANDAILQREDEDIKTRKTSPPMSPVSPRPSADQCPFCFFEEGLSPEDRMRPYARSSPAARLPRYPTGLPLCCPYVTPLLGLFDPACCPLLPFLLQLVCLIA